MTGTGRQTSENWDLLASMIAEEFRKVNRTVNEAVIAMSNSPVLNPVEYNRRIIYEYKTDQCFKCHNHLDEKEIHNKYKGKHYCSNCLRKKLERRR